LSNGSPQSGKTVDFIITQGSGTLSAPSAKTDSNGYASVTLSLANFTGNVQLSACVAPGDSPCQSVYGNAVAGSATNLMPVAGTSQIITLNHPFQPVIMRVTDASTPPNPVLGANVTFQSTVMRPAPGASPGGSGESNSAQPGEATVLSVSETTVMTDVSGLASLVPSVGLFTGPLEISVMIISGTNSVVYGLEALPVMSAPVGSPVKAPLIREPRNRLRRPEQSSLD
jgi:hypothetical protein